MVVYTSVDEVFAQPVAESFTRETGIDVRLMPDTEETNPLFGTTSMHAAALFAVLGDEKAKTFFEGFRGNGGKMLSSNGEHWVPQGVG